jgi:hypothetical protein
VGRRRDRAVDVARVVDAFAVMMMMTTAGRVHGAGIVTVVV